MTRYVLNRLVAMIITLFVIVTLGFCVLRLMPGSVYENPDLPAEVIMALEEKAHLNEPIVVQYLYFLKGVLFEGDWGVSVKIEPSVPVFGVIRHRIPITMQINIISLIISLPLGIIAGTVAALNKSRMPDHIVSFLVIVCISVPSFVFASLLQYAVGFKLGWLPIIYQGMADSALRLSSIILPVMALSFGPIATVARYLRGELIDTMSSEFMLLARTKGLTQYGAITRHAFRNSLVPLANIIIPMFTNILGGSLVVERMFSIPGVGGIMVKSVSASDHSLTIAILLFYSMISLATILLVDVSYGMIDPRIRLGGKE